MSSNPKAELKRPSPPDSQEAYDKARYRLVLSYAPPTHRCKKCGWPCMTGFCCNTCGDNDPTQPDQGGDSDDE